MRIRGKFLASGITVVALAAAAGCTGGKGPTASTQELTPAQRLAAAKTRLDAAPSVHLKLTSAEVPAGATGVVSAEGWGQHPPAFKGTFKVSLKGVQADAEVTSVDGGVWAKLPLVPGVNKIDPKAFGIPDPAVLFSPDKGLTNLLPATTGLALAGQARKGSEVLTRVTGKVPGSAVVDLFLIGDRSGTFDATYSLTDQQELREVTLAGPFFGTGTKSYYILDLDQYGKPVTITQPVG